MRWYLRSQSFRDIHQGLLSRGQVDAVCGVAFTPLRQSGRVLAFPMPDPEGVCPQCWELASTQVMIPATCSTHPDTEQVIGLVLRKLVNGRIELGSHVSGGCVLTVDASVLFDVLGEWLG